MHTEQPCGQLGTLFPQQIRCATKIVGGGRLAPYSAEISQAASKRLKALTAEQGGQPNVWTFRSVAKGGHLSDAIELLEQTGASERWRPLHEALRAVQAGSRQYLRRVAPEVRTAAEAIFDELAPERTEI